MYLDQLPGIEIANIDGIADAEQLTYVGVWNDLQATTADTFREDVIAEFGKRYLLKQITQTVDLDKGIDITALTAPNGDQFGLLFETSQQGDQCACSNLQDIYIQAVNFYWSGTNGSPSLTITAQDADQGTVLYTTTIVAVPGWNQVWVDMQFSTRRMYLFASGNFDNYVRLDLSQFNLNDFGTQNAYFGNGAGNAWQWYNFGGCGCQARVNGVEYTSASNLGVTGPNSFGLSAVFSTRCSFDSIVCANKKHFASAWQHCLAIELLNYRINSSRLNRWTTINKQQAIDLQKLYTLKYRGGIDKDTGLSYPGKLQNAIESIILNDADCCLQSNDYLIWREARF